MTAEFPAEVEAAAAPRPRPPRAARSRPHRPRARHDRPAVGDGPRPGAPHRARRRRLPWSTTRSPTSRPSSPPATRSTTRRTGAAQTLYGADSKIPLHPQVISEDAVPAARPGAPGAAVDDRRRRDRRGHRRRRGAGARALARQARLRGGPAPARRGRRRRVAAAAGGGGTLLHAREAGRGGVSLPSPSRRSTSRATAGTWSSRPLSRSSCWNAQISLLTGIAAAYLMVRGARRRAAHPPPARPARRRASAPDGAGPAHRLAGRARTTPTSSAPRPGASPPTPRWWWRARGCSAGAGTSRSTARCPPSRALGARLGVRARHRAAAPPRRPLRRRDLRGAVRGHRDPGLGASTGCPTSPR